MTDKTNKSPNTRYEVEWNGVKKKNSSSRLSIKLCESKSNVSKKSQIAIKKQQSKVSIQPSNLSSSRSVSNSPTRLLPQSKIEDLCRKIEARMNCKLQTSLRCEGVYVSGQAHAGQRVEAECDTSEKLDQWFEKQYLVEKEQSVSMCFRDFDKITCRLTISSQNIGQNG